MTASQIVEQLKPLGKDGTKKVLLNHGIKEPVLGVKIEDLKKLQKRIPADHQLVLALYDTGIYDAQYLAGLMADETKLTKKDLQRWLAKANCAALCGSVVAGVAAEGPHGWDLGLEWIESKDENTAQTGWTTLGMVVSVKDDEDLDRAALKRLLQRAERTIHTSPNHVRYAMNGFVIAVGSYVRELTDLAVQTAERIGEVTVDMGDTACKVPSASAYIEKVRKRGTLGKKRKMARC